MKLGLASSSAPDESLEELAAAAAHTLREAGLRLAGFRLADPAGPGEPALGEEAAAAWARFAGAIGGPLLVPLGRGREHRLRLLRDGGADVVAVLPANPFASPAALIGLPGDGPVAWDADPRAGLEAVTPRVLDRFGHRLVHVRLLGGGPEAAAQEGRGIGELMARLALAGFAGTMALAPSSTRYRVIWDAWLGRRGGWGCGSHDEDRSLVSLRFGP